MDEEGEEGGSEDNRKHEMFIWESKVIGKEESCSNGDESLRIEKGKIGKSFPLKGAFLEADENREKANTKEKEESKENKGKGKC